jgi:hypothetical protein
MAHVIRALRAIDLLAHRGHRGDVLTDRLEPVVDLLHLLQAVLHIVGEDRVPVAQHGH